MALYTFHDLLLEVKYQWDEVGQDLDRVLGELSWVTIPAEGREPSLRLTIAQHCNGLRIPSTAREMFRADGFCAFESEDDFYITDGSSLLHLQPTRGEGTAFISHSFYSKPKLLQSSFWAFSLLKLLRPLGLYSLHAAAVVTKEGTGLLLIGPSGSGKSTLAIGLVRHGWHYLSDDAVLLRSQVEGVEALALRKHLYVDTDAVPPFTELALGEEVPDSTGRRRRRITLPGAYVERQVAECIPHVLLFCRIVSQALSSLLPLERVESLQRLLAGGGPQLFDKGTMGRHLEVLKRLVQQCSTYELQAGLDLYRDPMTLVRLLNEVERERRWPGL